MKIDKTVINEERLIVNINQKELEDIVIKHIAEKANFKLTKDTKTNIIFSKNDKGVLGFLVDTKLELINSLDLCNK